MPWRFLTQHQPLGEGGFGTVYPCHLVEDGRVVDDDYAVKICAVPDGDDAEEWITRFRNGGQLGKRLRHPNIMPVEATGNRKDGTPFIIMPRASGGNLQTWIRRENPEESERIDLFRNVLEAVAYAHGQKILHRDIKPPNILLLDGAPVVSDFDLAKDIGPNNAGRGITETSVGLGSEGYMAPEQCTDLKRVGAQADVYALGRVLWWMLTDRDPVHLAPLDPLLVPAQFRAFIEKATEYRQDDRHSSATEMLRAFESLLAAPSGSLKKIAQDLVERWNADTGSLARAGIIKELDEHFQRHADDFELHYEIAPFLPPALLQTWMTERGAGFVQMVAEVMRASAGSLPWDDCDGFARFYLTIFQISTDSDLQVKALEEVLRIGATHNRYAVASMLRSTLDDIDSKGDARLVGAAVKAQQDHAAWFRVNDSVHPIIIKAFVDAGSKN